MLNKEVCIYCCNHARKSYIWGILQDEDRWRVNDRVLCFTWDYANTQREPPGYCPYALEHVLEMQGVK